MTGSSLLRTANFWSLVRLGSRSKQTPSATFGFGVAPSVGPTLQAPASVSNCALFAMSGVEWANEIQMAYDTTLDRPNDTSCSYEFSETYFSSDLLGNLDGAGSLQFRNCSVADVSLAGDRSATFSSCHLSDITLSETVALTLANGSRGTHDLGGRNSYFKGVPVYGDAGLCRLRE